MFLLLKELLSKIDLSLSTTVSVTSCDISTHHRVCNNTLTKLFLLQLRQGLHWGLLGPPGHLQKSLLSGSHLWRSIAMVRSWDTSFGIACLGTMRALGRHRTSLMRLSVIISSKNSSHGRTTFCRLLHTTTRAWVSSVMESR